MSAAAVAIVVLCAFVQDAGPAELLQVIEQQRGGRHWIDQPTDPPKNAEESQTCFEIEPGFRIELVVAEPFVMDPVAIDFDHRGRMFVVEYGDYPAGPADPDAEPLSQIVVLEDTDRDGKMDRRTVFADRLKFCHSLLVFRDGVLACTDSQIVYLADTSSDGVADVREVWFDGFIAAHPQMQIGCPRWGLDNWIYLTYGHGKVRCLRPGFETETPVDIPRVDFRFHPETMQFEAIAGAGQFGNTIDSTGRRYFSSNRNPIMTDVLPLQLIQQHPFAGVSSGHTDVGPAGEKTRVYPRVTMKSNWLSHAGTHTSACGVTACRSGIFGDEMERSVFVCEPVGHLITRSVIEPDGGTVTARRAREKADFLTSTDTWFRPASLATGPDGALYVADMYRLWVEHPKFVPDDVAAKMDWRAGEDRGRIWRIVPAEGTVSTITSQIPESVQTSYTAVEADVALLKHSNGWIRSLGQRRIVEGRFTPAEDGLRAILFDGSLPGLSRLHALRTLDGLDRLSDEDLIRAAADAESSVRRHVAELIRLRPDRAAKLQAVIASLLVDVNGEVRLQAVLSADPEQPVIQKVLPEAVLFGQDDIWLQRALLMVAASHAGEIAELVVYDSPDASFASTRSEFLRLLALNAAVSGETAQLLRITTVLGVSQQESAWWKGALISGLAAGLPRTKNEGLARSLPELIRSPPAELRETVGHIARVLEEASETAIRKDRNEADRVAAMGLMAWLPPAALTGAVEAILQPGESTVCQRAAIEAARRSGRSELADTVLTRWDALTPASRSAALDLLLQRPESSLSLLETMERGEIAPSVVSIDQRLLLLQHRDEQVRRLAGTLFGGTVSANRREVAEQYAKALELKGDTARGAQVFEKTCSKCHRIGATGHNVGPDISDTRARALDALLYDILDPNRRVDPQFTEYVVVTADGQLFNGLMISETRESVTLRQPEGREQTIARSEIEELRSTNRSLMPEGIERDVSVEQMADLLQFLRE